MTSSSPPAPAHKLFADPLVPNGDLLDPPSLPRQTESNVRSTSIGQLPPEIRHWAEDYEPLGKLFGRAAQDAFNGLDQLLSELAQLPDVPQLNGASSASDSAQASAAGAQKRLKWLDFASTQRERFIKLSVISQWSKRITDIEKLVDINLWLTEQFDHFRRAEAELAELRRSMSAARLPSPDIDTALRVLGSGASSSISHLGYVPPEPLGPAQILKTLQDLNLLLHIRLNLHEDLPPHFRHFHIHSGRATFAVPHEFEVDLSIADDSPSSQFWFVDFRLSFSSVSEIPAAPLRGSLEHHVNAVLADEGLAGCYDFLHEFALTHKINLLRKQAVDLSRGSWAGSLRVEHMRRCLVVQYWSSRPGRKSWIQVGVQRGPSSHLFVKCVHAGKDAPDAAFPLAPDQLDMDSILSRATTQHVRSILASLESRYLSALSTLSLSPLDAALLDVRLHPTANTLFLPLQSSSEASVFIEPVTGNYLLQPVTPPAERYQSTLNSVRDAVRDPFIVLEKWRSAEMQSAAESVVANSGFVPVSIPALAFDAIKRAFGPDVVRATFFTHSSWASSDWHLAAVIEPFSLKWFVARISALDRGTVVASAEPMPGLDAFFDPFAYPKLACGDLERLAVAKISLSALASFLKSRKIPFTIEQSSSRSATDSALFRFSAPDLLELKTGGAARPTFLASEDSVLIVHGLEKAPADGAAPLVRYTMKGQLDRRKVRPEVLRKLEGPLLKVDPQGRIALRVNAPLGSEDALAYLAARLRSLQRLGYFLIILNRHHIPCQSISESHATFQYSTTESLTATINLNHGAPGKSIAVDFQPRRKNPHARIARFLDLLLNQAIKEDPLQAIDGFLRELALTLPLLETLDALEEADPSTARLRVHVGNTHSYTLAYPQVRRAFRVMFARRRPKSVWTIRPAADAKPAGPGQAKVHEQIAELFARSGDGWAGLRDGIIAETRGIGAAVRALDKVMKDCQPAVKPEPSVGPTPAAPAAAQPNGHNAAKKAPPPAQKKQKSTPAQQQQQQRIPSGPVRKVEESDVVVLD